MAQLHNGNLHCLRRTGKNGKQIALYVSKDTPKIYKLCIYKRIRSDEPMMKLDMEFVFADVKDAKYKYDEYVANL